MKLRVLVLIMFGLPILAFGRVIIVDINGSGNYTSIQPAINAAFTGDTVKVLPGVYVGQINLSKSIFLIGSGYETTKMQSDVDPTLNMSLGRIMWFGITCNAGNGRGILLAGGQVKNCVVSGCQGDGIRITQNSTGTVANCVIYQNGGSGVFGPDANNAAIYNCISVENASWGFSGAFFGPYLNVTYSDGSAYYVIGVGNIDINPGFIRPPADFHISASSPCWDTGKPDVSDPDGTRSDMGYFGGPETPIYPIVTEIRITPLGTGVQIRAVGRANY
jgi:hypothetical protein